MSWAGRAAEGTRENRESWQNMQSRGEREGRYRERTEGFKETLTARDPRLWQRTVMVQSCYSKREFVRVHVHGGATLEKMRKLGQSRGKKGRFILSERITWRLPFSWLKSCTSSELLLFITEQKEAIDWLMCSMWWSGALLPLLWPLLCHIIIERAPTATLCLP